MKKKYFKEISAWLPLLLWASLIFKLSSGTVPSVSTVYIQDYIFKKGAHIFFFGMIGVLTFRALRMNGVGRKKAAICGIIFAILYGASDEFHQSFTQGRESRITDVGYDGFGGSLALALTYFVLPKLPENFFNFFKELDLI